MRESKEKRRGGEKPRAEGAGSGLGKTGGASSVASHAAPGAAFNAASGGAPGSSSDAAGGDSNGIVSGASRTEEKLSHARAAQLAQIAALPNAAARAEAAKRERMPNRAADLSRQSTTDSGRRRDRVWTGRAARAASDCPVILKLMFVLLLAVSALGEWNKINTVLGGLPKIITAGIILSALVYAIIRPNLQRVRELLSPTLLYLGLIVFLLIWSLVIWIFDFSDMSSMIRGGSKMVFQTVSMLTAVSAVYMFGIEAIDLFALGIGAANGLIMLLEIPNYGIVESIRSLINCITTFGGAEGYARSLEIHDLTFVFGQLLLYYAVFAPTETEDQRRHRRRYILLTGFFFIVGMKRIAIPAVVLFALVGLLLRKRQRLTKFFIFLGFAWTAFFLLYIYGVRTGIVSRLFGTLGIDMMGREYLWQLANRCYTFSPAYMGHGFEYIDTVVGQWYQEGLLKVAYAFHNDILKVFVEIGFPGLMGWALSQYVAYPVFWVKYADTRTALLYVCELGYMTVSYLTDNTAFYFWCTMALRLVTLAYAVSRRREVQEPKWQQLDRRSVSDLIGIMMKE